MVEIVSDKRSPAEAAITQPAASRGSRLYPARSSRLYWHLTCLRHEIESVVREYIADNGIGCLVDFGCGNMPYRSLFEPHVGEYMGCDFEGNEQAELLITSDGRLPLDSGTADVVLSTQVLEHAAEPAEYLGEAGRVLRAGGWLILSTHGAWKYHPDPGDFWRWTCDGLRRQLEYAGFEIRRFRGVMGPEATAIQLWQDSVLQRVPKRLRVLFTYIVQSRIRKADLRCPDHVRDRDACVYFVTARKSEKTA